MTEENTLPDTVRHTGALLRKSEALIRHHVDDAELRTLRSGQRELVSEDPQKLLPGPPDDPSFSINMPDVDRLEVRLRVLHDDDIDGCLIHLATEGLVDLSDLYWLLGIHGIMAPRSAWLLAGMWADALPHALTEAVADPDWWEFFDRDCGGP